MPQQIQWLAVLMTFSATWVPFEPTNPRRNVLFDRLNVYPLTLYSAKQCIGCRAKKMAEKCVLGCNGKDTIITHYRVIIYVPLFIQ